MCLWVKIFYTGIVCVACLSYCYDWYCTWYSLSYMTLGHQNCREILCYQNLWNCFFYFFNLSYIFLLKNFLSLHSSAMLDTSFLWNFCFTLLHGFKHCCFTSIFGKFVFLKSPIDLPFNGTPCMLFCCNLSWYISKYHGTQLLLSHLKSILGPYHYHLINIHNNCPEYFMQGNINDALSVTETFK